MNGYSQKKFKIAIEIVMIIVLLCVNLFTVDLQVNAQEDSVNMAKQGIVEIYSGIVADDETFHKLKHSSGILINNKSDSACILTTYDTLRSSDKQIEKYCKKNNIAMDGYSMRTSIRIVVKGDVTVEASILTESEKENYSILQVGSVISERTPVKFGAVSELMTGDTVYTLGFPEDAGENDDEANRHMQFTAMDVEINQGTIRDTGANKNGVLYLQHSAEVTSGNTGGALLNEEGYVIGINNYRLSDDDTYTYYSLPVTGIRDILNNFQISYESMERDDVISKYQATVEECTKLLEDKSYKNNSKTTLREVMQSVESITGEEETEVYVEYTEKLENAKEELVLKMKTTKKIMIVLAVVIVFELIWLIRILIWKSKQKGNAAEKKTEKKSVKKAEKKEQKKVVYEEPTVYLDTENEKTVKTHKTRAYIIREKDGRKCYLDKTEFFIGKREEGNDLVLADNKAISRSHACITKKDGAYYIKDLNSANGTFVNNIAISPDKAVALKDRDIIILADEKVAFRTEK